MNIREFVKEKKKEIGAVALLALIISLSFGLGFLTAEQYYQAPIIIEKYSK